MKRLLFIAHRLPYPPDKGERTRAYREVRSLGEHFEVTVAAPVCGAAESAAAAELGRRCCGVITAPAGRACRLARGAISMAAGRSVTEGFFNSPPLHRLIAAEAACKPFDIVFAYSSAVVPLALSLNAAAHVADLVDADSAKWSAYADSSPWPMSGLYRREARAVGRLERLAGQACDAVAVVSAAEAQAAGLTGPKLVVAGNGVDSVYFSPRPRPPHGPPSIVFTGTMDYRPNAAAVCWFVREVWPNLRRQAGDMNFIIVGRDPTPAVQKLASHDGVLVTGAVDDVRPYLAGAIAAVVPLGIARGVQNKILEAMASGRAVVASPAAMVGLDLPPGEVVLQAATPQQWQQHITDLLNQPERRRRMEQAARAVAEKHFNWDACLAPLVDACVRLAAGTKPAAGGQP